MFMLIWDWCNESHDCYEININWYDTKEELLNAYKEAKENFSGDIESEMLYLSAGVNYSWADIDRLF